METPKLVSIGLNSTVYEPAEDSFLLLDAIEQQLDFILSQEPLFVLEVGCGSGIISTALAKAFRDGNTSAPITFAIDVNPEACVLTRENCLINRKISDFGVQTILMDGTKTAFREPFDIIMCNPPYVPVHPGEHPEDAKSGLLEKSWTGGPDGNSFIIPFLSNVGKLLSDSGSLYLLLSSWNNPEMLLKDIAEPNGLKGKMIIKRSAGRERLSVWKFSKML